MDERAELEELRRLAELEARASGSAASAAPPQSAPPTPAPQPTGGTFMEGAGAGLREGSRGLGNVLMKTLNMVTPQGRIAQAQGQPLMPAMGPVSDEAVAAEQARNEGVDNSTAGWWGKMVGSALPTAVSAAVTRGAPVGQTANLGARILGGNVARVGLEGAAGGASMAAPNAQVQGALEGATGGVVLNRLGAGGKRMLTGLVEKSDAAKNLLHLAGQHGKDLFVPISQAADEAGDALTRTMRMLYREGLPLVPGVSGQFKRQSDNVVDEVREMALREADPIGNVITPALAKEGLQARRVLKSAFDKEYQDTVKSYAFNVPGNLRQRVEDRIKANMPSVDQTTLKKVADLVEDNMRRFSDGKASIDGTNLLSAKNAVNSSWRKLQGPEKEALRHAVGEFDEIIKDDLTAGNSPQNLADLARYQGLAEPWKAFRQVGGAIEDARKSGGQFSPAQLANNAKDPGVLSHLGVTANRVLGSGPSAPSTAGRVAAYSAGALGGFANLPATLAVIGGLNAAATKGAQKTLMGDTTLQRALTNALRRNPNAAEIAGLTGRAAVTSQLGDE